jgi:PncC family amidohydrolase
MDGRWRTKDHAEHIATALVRRAQTVAVAETSAGGLISATLIGVPGASRWFVGAVVPYGRTARSDWLGVGEIEAGAVSGEMAVSLAESVRDRTGATWGVGETGVAGPQTGRRSQKPSGLCFVAVAGPHGTTVEHISTAIDDREINQWSFAEAALSLLARCL